MSYKMLNLEDIQQLRKVHLMIQKKRTGTPDEFASTLCVSRRKMYYLLDTIKELGAQISYSRTNHTFYYQKSFDIDISLKICKNGSGEWEDISGGFTSALAFWELPCIILHGSEIP